MPKMKKTKKQSSRTLPSIGRVSSSNVTRIRMPVGAEEPCWGSQRVPARPSDTSWQSSPRGSTEDDVKDQLKMEGTLAHTPNSPRQPIVLAILTVVWYHHLSGETAVSNAL